MGEPQECFADDCETTYGAPVLEKTGNRCPGCGVWSIECPACETIVSMDAILDRFVCPYCGAGKAELASAFDTTETEAVEA